LAIDPDAKLVENGPALGLTSLAPLLGVVAGEGPGDSRRPVVVVVTIVDHDGVVRRPPNIVVLKR
jgi:hypothetical protein